MTYDTCALELTALIEYLVGCMQFTRPELALQFEEALRNAGLSSMDPVIREMGAGDAPALEIGEFEVNRGTRLMILGFSRPQLIR